MNQFEPTRTRRHGTKDINTTQAEDPGLARIEAVQAIVDECQYRKIDGLMVDLFTAEYIVQVYKAISPENQEKYRNCSIQKMASIAFKLCK